MAERQLHSPELLRKLLNYDPDTGTLTWRVCRGRARVGGPAGNLSHTGYIQVVFEGRPYRAHRVGWAIYYGKWPTGYLDHLNHIRTDNRIANLREVTRQENGRNRCLQVNNTSGKLGVHWDKRLEKWRASVTVDGRRKHLGMFARFEDAAAARCEAERQFGFHENHGRTLPAPNNKETR